MSITLVKFRFFTFSSTKSTAVEREIYLKLNSKEVDNLTIIDNYEIIDTEETILDPFEEVKTLIVEYPIIVRSWYLYLTDGIEPFLIVKNNLFNMKQNGTRWFDIYYDAYKCLLDVICNQSYIKTYTSDCMNIIIIYVKKYVIIRKIIDLANNAIYQNNYALFLNKVNKIMVGNYYIKQTDETFTSYFDYIARVTNLAEEYIDGYYTDVDD